MKKIFIAIIITLLFIPLGCIFHLKQFTHLIGAEEIYSRPVFSIKNIIDSSYQDQFEKWYQQNFFLRNSLVKLRNQLYYWINLNSFFYGQNNTIIRGKDKYLYEEVYLKIRIPDQKLNEKQIALLKQIVQECHNNQVDIYFIIAPDKVSSYPEFLSDLYTFFYHHTTNYAEEIENILQQHDIPVYNTQRLIFQLKNENIFPPYPKTGTHWNLYGAGRAVQESLNYFNLASMTLTHVESSKKTFLTERDISNILNLPIRYRTNEDYYMPHFTVSAPLDSSLTIIGNSYSHEYEHIVLSANLLEAHNLKYFGNEPLSHESGQQIWETKKFFFIYTPSAFLNPDDQLYKKIQILLDTKPH